MFNIVRPCKLNDNLVQLNQFAINTERGKKAKTKDVRIEVENIPWRMESGVEIKKMQFYKTAIHSNCMSAFYVPDIVLGHGMV